MVVLKTETLPRGSRGWDAFVESLTKVDDLAEGHWLEMKSELDVGRTGAAKIAKFILGAANRQPDVAARVMEGYALMVLGVGPGLKRGIDRIEDKDLETRLMPYLGADGPLWETQRIAVDGGRDVLVIIVEPPQQGDPIYVCRKDGEGVADGEIYLRAMGETRRARSGEVDLLRARERGRRANIEVEVAVAGPVRAYTCDPRLLDDYAEAHRQRLLDALPKPPAAPTAALSALAASGSELSPMLQRFTIDLAPSLHAMSEAFTVPEARTEDAFRDEVEEWATVCRRSLSNLVDGYIAHTVTPTSFTIRNATERYLSDVRVNLHLAGAVEQLESDGPQMFSARRFLPRLPREWGPRPRDYGIGSYTQVPYTPDFSNLRSPSGPQATFRNGGSVDAVFTLPELRPRGVEELSGEIVLLVRDASMTVIEGRWQATARDIDAIFDGTCVIPVEEPIDLTDLLRAALAPRQ